VMVVDKGHIVLANAATYQLLGISNQPTAPIKTPQVPPNGNKSAHQHIYGNPLPINPFKRHRKPQSQQTTNPLFEFQQQLQEQHLQLLDSCLSVSAGQSRTFIYELPATTTASAIDKLRIQIIPLKDYSQLILLEDLRREQANAQQLKLASLGQLTASIAHEIRNPLAAISQASQLLMEDVVDSENKANSAANVDSVNNAKGSNQTNQSAANAQAMVDMANNHELYKMIFAQTKRVNRIIEDVLNLSRQQQPNQQPIALATWMPQFLDNYFQGHDVFLRRYSQPTIQFDTHQLEQILINLINNGLRYSSLAHPHAYVEVEIYCRQNDVIIDILDNGNGVDSSNIEQLFNPFYTTDKAGTGLGLYISQAFSEANHARLLYAPEHTKTCFRLIIPVTSCPAGAKGTCACYNNCQ
jgi:two-component system sensor histidine kinase PilS (NtrC family)